MDVFLPDPPHPLTSVAELRCSQEKKNCQPILSISLVSLMSHSPISKIIYFLIIMSVPVMMAEEEEEGGFFASASSTPP